MREIAFQRVSRIMRDSPLVFSSTDTVSELLGSLYQSGSYEALVAYENRVGLITVRDLLGISHPERTLLGKIAKSAPYLSPESTVLDAVNSMVANKIRALPILENGEIIGIISQKEIVNALPESSIFEEIMCKEVMKVPVISVDVNDKVSTARSIMRRHGISHLPAVNARGWLKGMITAKDIVFAFIQPGAGVTRGERVGETVRTRDMPVKALMDRRPLTATQKEPLLGVVRDFKRYEKDACVVKKGSGVLGIITSREIIPLLLSFKVERALPVYILGLPEFGDFLDVETAQSKIIRVLDKGLSFYRDVQEVVVDVKQRKRRGGRTLYQVTARVYSPTKRFSVSAEGWYLSKAFDNLCRKLDRKLGSVKKRKRKPETLRVERPEPINFNAEDYD